MGIVWSHDRPVSFSDTRRDCARDGSLIGGPVIERRAFRAFVSAGLLAAPLAANTA